MGAKRSTVFCSQEQRSQSESSDANAGESGEKGSKVGSSDPHEEKGRSPDRRQEKQPDDIARAHVFAIEFPKRVLG